uniref:DUF4705 domain-containing protein n=1 Tax=Piliocolobus tephrosceles TaxID=591936 RepID=A0A8C9GYM2_9PRIM
MVASPGSAPALQRCLHAADFLQPARLGPARASQRPLQAQAVPESASPGPAAASRRPLQARNILRWAPPGPAPASPPTLRWGLQAPDFLQPVSLGPARASRRPLQAQAIPEDGPCSRRPLQAQRVLQSVSPGPAPPACHWPLQAQPRSRLLAAFLGPASDFLRPSEAQDLTSSRPLHAQPPASRRLARAQPLPHSGLSTPSSRLTAASPGQSSSCFSAAPTGPALASQRPL